MVALFYPGSPPMTGSTTITIRVDDINDNFPVLDANSRIVKVTEGQSAGFLKTLTAEDPDTAKYGPPFRFDLPVCGNAKPSICGKFSFEKASELFLDKIINNIQTCDSDKLSKIIKNVCYVTNFLPILSYIISFYNLQIPRYFEEQK